MNKLFIIGNGFDMAHDIKSSYQNFKDYLICKYDDVDTMVYSVPESTLQPDGSECYNDDEVVNFLIYIISQVEGKDWRDLETTLGKLNFNEFFDDLYQPTDRDGDPDLWKTAYQNEDLAQQVVSPVLSITKFFSEWIDSLKIDNSIAKIGSFAGDINIETDQFLTFNYTETLEKVYDAKHVCHIHGKQGEEMLIGHGDDTYEEDMIHIGSEDSLNRTKRKLRKETEKALKKHRTFFTELISSNIDKIYSFGFSFAEVDEIYIKEVCDRLNTEKITWYLNSFDSEKKREKFKATIIACGFKGNFNIYSYSR